MGRSSGDLGLRERKKLATRVRIAKAALELTERKGFEATTVSEIAAAADVSPRTVFGHFPSKEAIFFGDSQAILDGLDARLSSLGEGETVAEALREWLLSIMGDREEKEAILADRRRRVIDDEAALRTYERGLLERGESTIARAVAAEIGRADDEMLPRMVAAATIAALESIGRRLEDRSQEEAVELLEGYVEDLTAFIAGGIGALVPPS
jgi:AcrR family transcriptional regulator